MGLMIRLLKGSWFRLIYKNTDKNDRFVQVINSEHIKKNIEFLDEKLTRIKLTGHHIKVGRNSSNHIVLDDDRVSRYHCEIIKHPLGHWYIRDLDSSSGTHIKRGTSIVREETGSLNWKERMN
jgi:predicted component of type VI protein secretion system